MIENLDTLTSARPFFIPDSKGDLYSIFYPAASECPKDQVIVHIPAFAEEMNKSRRMVALQARKLTDQGISVLVVDLFGTGDSKGDFSETCWEIWKDNLSSACRWLQQKGVSSISFWGLRMGALLAMDFAPQCPVPLNRLLLWQPVLNGETLIMQFLRLRIAVSMFTDTKSKETTSGLRKQLANGQPLEIAGYTLNPDLATPLMKLRANRLDASPFKRISIFEVISDIERKASPANQKFVTELQQQGIDSALRTVVGSPFWSTQEIAVAPNLLRETTHSMTQQQKLEGN